MSSKRFWPSIGTCKTFRCLAAAPLSLLRLLEAAPAAGAFACARVVAPAGAVGVSSASIGSSAVVAAVASALTSSFWLRRPVGRSAAPPQDVVVVTGDVAFLLLAEEARPIVMTDVNAKVLVSAAPFGSAALKLDVCLPRRRASLAPSKPRSLTHF